MYSSDDIYINSSDSLFTNSSLQLSSKWVCEFLIYLWSRIWQRDVFSANFTYYLYEKE